MKEDERRMEGGRRKDEGRMKERMKERKDIF